MVDKIHEDYLKTLEPEDARYYREWVDRNCLHRQFKGKDDVVEYYRNKAKTYETKGPRDKYNGPIITAEAVVELYPKDRECVKILDVAAGTGLLAEELKKYGYEEIHALDPSQEMLNVAKTKNVYRKFFCEFMDEHKLPINEDYYDLLVCVGGMCEGHIPCVAMREMSRIVKPGGYVCFSILKEYLADIKEYNNMEPMMRKMENEGLWKMVSRTIDPRHFYLKPGMVFVFQIC